MQKDKEIEEMTSFMMPVNALEAAGFEDGEMLRISAKKGKIVVKSVKPKARKCHGNCGRCCGHFPCSEIYE